MDAADQATIWRKRHTLDLRRGSVNGTITIPFIRPTAFVLFVQYDHHAGTQESQAGCFRSIFVDRAAGTQVGSAGLIRQKGVNRTGSKSTLSLPSFSTDFEIRWL
ncbi:MAG: hypothetical protein ACREBR_00430, partial [bacterium]